MKSIQISLNSIEKVKQFVNLISVYDCDFDLSSDRYIIDAKSIMGIFSLDLGKPLRLDIYDEQVADDVIKSLAPFIYNA